MRRWIRAPLLRDAPSPRRYFRDAKPAFLQLIDPRGLRVLDLGCGGGHNGALLKKAGAREVVGVELDPGAAQEARKRLDRVVECDLAKLDPADLGDEPFDAILASDVLEHLLRRRGRARPGGHAAAPGRRRRPLAAQHLQRLRLLAAAAQDVAAAQLGHLRPHPRALLRQARHGPAAAGRRPARAARRAVLHPLPGDQDRVAGPVAVRLPRLLGEAVPAARRQAGRPDRRRHRDRIDQRSRVN